MQVLERRQGDLQVALRATRFHTYCRRCLLASSRLPGTTLYRVFEPPGLSIAPIEALRE
jgi:hypothetical protein